jgi:predicted enzyme related to lactoylglutathione lyase
LNLNIKNIALLKKIDENTNIITWFEIPVIDVNRAKTFYETILDIKMIVRKDGDVESVFFPYNSDVIQATSGRVTGVLVKSERNKPSSNGTIVYINASPNLQTALDKVEQAGGKVLTPKMQIPPGYIAMVLDSEGNRVGLHAEQ